MTIAYVFACFKICHMLAFGEYLKAAIYQVSDQISATFSKQLGLKRKQPKQKQTFNRWRPTNANVFQKQNIFHLLSTRSQLAIL